MNTAGHGCGRVQMEAEPEHWDGRRRWSEGELDGTWRDRGPVNSINVVTALIKVCG